METLFVILLSPFLFVAGLFFVSPVLGLVVMFGLVHCLGKVAMGLASRPVIQRRLTDAEFAKLERIVKETVWEMQARGEAPDLGDSYDRVRAMIARYEELKRLSHG
ncbi:MAG: hypothetical protein U1E62_22610 [Alsobacter sp.]